MQQYEAQAAVAEYASFACHAAASAATDIIAVAAAGHMAVRMLMMFHVFLSSLYLEQLRYI